MLHRLVKQNQISSSLLLNPKVDSPQFAATVAAAAPLQHYQIDPVHQPLDLSNFTWEVVRFESEAYGSWTQSTSHTVMPS